MLGLRVRDRAVDFRIGRYCQRQGTARCVGGEAVAAGAITCRVLMEKTMRALRMEELELVAGADTTNSASKCNNGLGNGNQLAPGNSLNNNQAENGTTDPHASGKAVDQNGAC